MSDKKAKSGSAIRWERWSKRHPERANARAREWRQRNPKYMLFHSAKRRALTKGIEFTITMEDIPDLPETCPIALIPIKARNDGKRGPCENSPSLDRVDTTGGYTCDNIRIISHRGNRWKSDMTIEDITRILKYMKGQL